MSLDNAKNFAKVTVSTGYNSSDTSIVLTTGHGAKMPTAPFNAVWYNATDYSDPSDDPNVEVVRVTAVSTDTLTVTRGQEGISATTKNTGGKTYKMIAGLTAKVINTDIPALISPAQIIIVDERAFSWTDIAINSGNTRVIAASASTTIRMYKNVSGAYSDSFIRIANVTTTISTSYATYHSGTSKFYLANNSTGVAQVDDADTLTNETNITFSGTTPTAIIGIASDGTNVWILDDNSGTKRLIKYSVSGTTFTSVSTQNLDTNNPTQTLAYIDTTHIYTLDLTNKVIYRFNTSGVTQSSLTFPTVTNVLIRGLMNDAGSCRAALVTDTTNGINVLARITV